MTSSNRLAITLAIASVFSLPTISAAATLAPESNATYCQTAPVRLQTLESHFTASQTVRQANEGKENTRLQDYRTASNTTLTAKRAKWDTNRSQWFVKLQGISLSSTSKTAEASFEASIDAAVATKRAGNDAATAQFRTKQDAAIGVRRASVAQAIATRNQAVLSAGQQVASGCAAGTGNVTVIRSGFKASIANAQSAFKATDSAAWATYSATMKQLQSDRKATEATNYATYKASVSAASVTYKAARGANPLASPKQ